MERKVLDYTLVPLGLVIMFTYHAWLFHRFKKYPHKTVLGVNSINRRMWVRSMMEDVAKNGILAVQTLRNNIMASTLLASTAIMLCSMLGIMMTNGGVNHSWFFNFGDKSDAGYSIRFFAILMCFFAAFLLNVQSIRYYSHASILINVPYKKVYHQNLYQQVSIDYVLNIVDRGSYFWSMGLRAFYLSFPLFFWIFGPIPMFLSCCVLVIMLLFLDVSFDCGWAGVTDSSDSNPGGNNVETRV